MKFKGKTIEELTIEELKDLITRWIEFKLTEEGLKFTLIGTYDLVDSENDIKLVEKNNVSLIDGQKTYLSAYKRVVNEELVPFEQMANELNGVKY